MKNLEKTTGLLGALPPSETLGSLVKGIELARKGIKVNMLSVGEPDFDTPAPIKTACFEAMKAGMTKYTIPAGISELREACAEKFHADGIVSSPAQVVVTPGGKFACAAAITALCGPGDEVIVPANTYIASVLAVTENGATPVLEPELEPWGQRTCYIADPEGNLIEIGSWNKPYDEKDLTEG